MALGFGFCPNCGTPRISTGQKFCAECGLTLTLVAPIAPPATPIFVAQPVEPVPPTIADEASAPPVTAPPGASGGGFKVTLGLLATVAIGLAVIAGAYLYASVGSTSSGIIFSPSTVSCSAPAVFTATAHLPSSVHAGDTVTITLDGKTAGTSQVSPSGSDVTQQADGSWVSISTTSLGAMRSLCAAGSSTGVLTPGTHTMQVLDSSGNVLAQGSYTVTPSGL
jgi:hypothetical protein